MLEVDAIRIPETEYEWSFVRSGGPGGQNVNKVASKAVLRWKIRESSVLDEAVKLRFLGKFATRITTEGELVLSSQRYRDQDRNRQDCVEKLAAMIHAATVVPRPRQATKPTKASKRRRVDDKRKTSQVKSRRRTPRMED